jgi:hypothetical protein
MDISRTFYSIHITVVGLLALILGYLLIVLGTTTLEKHSDLALMHIAVLKLMQTLLYRDYQFTLFYGNLFGNPKLFSLLWSLGIGACRTTQRQITKLVFGNIDE